MVSRYLRQGLCFTANSVYTTDIYNLSNAFVWNKYTKDPEGTQLKHLTQATPYYTKQRHLGLEIKVSEADSHRTFEPEGYRVAIHNPCDVVHESQLRLNINFNKDLLLLVTPHMKTVDETVSAMSPKE